MVSTSLLHTHAASRELTSWLVHNNVDAGLGERVSTPESMLAASEVRRARP